jgi:hypothetical protein
MDCNFIVRPTLAWADSYEDAEDYDDDSQDDDDETIQDLIAAHELWKAMLKSWAEAKPVRNLK